MTSAARVDLADLGFDEGAHLLVGEALGRSTAIDVVGAHPDLATHLRAWARSEGHGVEPGPEGTAGRVRAGALRRARWHGAEAQPEAPADRAPPGWGLAPRGTWVEAGGPEPHFALDGKDEVWSDDAARLYQRALAGQWDPATAVPWGAPLPDDPVVEAAVAQVMAYLVENEEAALVVPARFLGQVHPHFTEVQHVLAAQVADEARHAHAFARRARLGGAGPLLSTAGGRASLQTLLDEPSWPVASFLLSVLGEGTFLSLLGFVEDHAPDEATRVLAHLARADEARHVAFGLGHLERHCDLDPTLRSRLAAAAERRHDALAATAGLNPAVFDGLLVLASPERTPEGVRAGWAAVQGLQADMAEGRRHRLARLGFTPGEAEAIAALHTRSFM